MLLSEEIWAMFLFDCQYNRNCRKNARNAKMLPRSLVELLQKMY